MTHHYVAGEGALWTQPNGPNTQPVYLGCHQIGDIDEPQGDVELIYCPDPSGPSRFKVVNSLQGAAGAVTTSITTDITDELDHLERTIKCTVPIYVHMVKSGLMNVFTNYDRSFVLTGARVTSRGLTGLTARTPDDNSRSEQTFELSAESLIRAVRLEIAKQSFSGAQNINDIAFCNMETCGTDDEIGMDACQVGYVVCNAASGSSADVFKTTNGATWAITGLTDPFATSINITAIECFEMGRDSTRLLVAGNASTAPVSNQIAYSDDNGATWTTVTLAASTGIPNNNSLFALNRSLILAGARTGYIYRSDDGGTSWSAVESAGIHSGAWNAIHMANEEIGWAGGAENKIARTLDGGDSWAAISGPSVQDAIAGSPVIPAVAINTIYSFDRNKAWIGYADGKLFFTRDGGVTWTQRTYAGSGTGSIKDIKFLNEYVGIMVRNSSGSVGNALMTIDGGYTWEPMTTPTNNGLNAAYMCNEHSFYIVGDASGGNGYIAKAGV